MTTLQTKITTTACPFESSPGYTTVNGRVQYLVEHGVREKDAKCISTFTDADPDPSAPLYFWQLYSLIGHEPIVSIVQNFYERVYGDDEELWFRNAFDDIGGIDHHVQTQALYWMDAFGGGKMYHGGNSRLNFHHHWNASHVMNAKGAKRWMHHMQGALQENEDKFDDKRIMPCIVDFLKVKMKTYAKEHGWEFDEGDFEFAKNMSVASSVGSNDDEYAA